VNLKAEHNLGFK